MKRYPLSNIKPKASIQRKGFTLIEVLVSLVIVTSLVAVMYSLLYHLHLTIEEEELLRATLLAKEKIMEKSLTTENGRFKPPDDRFYYEKTLLDTPFSGLKLLRITVGSERDLITMERFVSVNHE